MDRLTHYQQIIHREIATLAERYGTSDESNVDQVVVLDDTHGVYLIYQLGWQEHDRVKIPWVQIRLKNGKFWIEEDWTQESVVERLLTAGVPNEDIVLGFNPPDMRQYTEFAVA